MVAVLQAACVRQAAAVPRACAAARPAAMPRPRSCFSSSTPAAFQHSAAAWTERQWACGTSRRPAAAAAAASSEAATEEAVASPGDYCECHYTVSTEDGTVIDSSKASSSENEVKEIARFILGGGRVVAGFHQAVGGLAVGESRKHRVVPEDAYGERTDEMVVRIPKGQAPEGLEAGMVVGLTNGMQAVVAAVDEEAVTIDANHPLAGQALFFEVELTKRIPAAQLETATFGAGCFWSVELAFQRVPGVVQTAVGFSQGGTAATTYELVCTGSTGHNEVVQVVYDPSEVSYEQLLDAFWAKHDPTTLNRQGGDVGTQYRSGIYWHTEEQRRIAEVSLAAQNERLGGNVVTEIEQVKNFSEAEEYHQRYLEKGGRNGQAQSAAKGCTDPIRCYG